MARRKRRRRRRAPSRAIVKYRNRYVARPRRRRRSNARSSLTGGNRVKLSIAAAAYGYAKKNWAGFNELMAKVPFTLGNEAFTFGVVAHFANKHLIRSPWLDHAATAGLVLGAYQFGATGGFGGGATVEGYGYNDGGWVGAADFDPADLDEHELRGEE